jgi:hypothetical protein
MMYVVLLAAAATAQTNTYWPQDLPWTYDVGYTVLMGKECSFADAAEDAYKEIKVGDVDDLYLHECSYKCSVESNPGKKTDKDFCEEGDGDVTKFVLDKEGVRYEVPCHCPDGSDAERDNVVCASAPVCEALCDSSPECYAFHMDKTATKCILLKEQCQPLALTGTLSDSASYDYFAMMDPEKAGGEGCPMGLAVEPVRPFTDILGNCPEINDQYNKDPDEIAMFFTACSELTWNAGACGWMLTVDTPVSEEAMMEKELCDAPQCLNKVPEANFLFGYTDFAGKPGDMYDEHICERSEYWLQGGYCTQNALWRALCPEECVDVTCDECEAWTEDNSDAAEKLVDLLNMTVAAEEGCTTLFKASMCYDPVVAVVCEATCGSEEMRRLSPSARLRRLSKANRELVEGYQRTYREAFKVDMEAIEREYSARQLAGHETTLFTSWNPTVGSPGCDPTMDPDYEMITSSMWYDLYSWRTTTYHIEIHPVCEEQDTFTTFSDTYCNTNNMVIDHPDMTGDLCFNKCNLDGTAKDPLKDDGTCAGMDPAFNRYSNALCVTRPTCEAYSKMAGGVWGFEMHKSLPRCYLIDEKCPDADLIPSPLYDQVEKTRGFISYLTGYDMACPETGTMSAADVNLEREACELTCSESDTCYGFNYYHVLKKCEFFDIVPEIEERNAVGMCSTGAFDYAKTGTMTAPNLAPSTGAHFVEKELVGESMGFLWRVPCAVDVRIPEPIHYQGWGTSGAGRYSRDECDGTLCFKNGRYSLMWADAAGAPDLPDYLDEHGAASRKCAGWVLVDDHAGGATEQTYTIDGVERKYPVSDYIFTTFSPTECPSEPSDPDAAISEGYMVMYGYMPSNPEAMPRSGRMEYVCKSYPVCGTLQTCVMAKNRFYAEMSSQYGVSAPFDPAAFIPAPASPAYRPKTLISVGLAAAFVAAGKEEFATQLYRNVPGHFRILIGELSAGVDKAIIKMASASGEVMGQIIADASGTYAGYEPWYTDIIRVELFDAKGDHIFTGASVDIDIYAPGVPQLSVFKYDEAGALAAGFPAIVLKAPGSRDYHRLTVTGTGDYVGTTEKKCMTLPGVANSAASWTCSTNHAGDMCPVTCMDGYVPKGELLCQEGEWVVAPGPTAPTLATLCAAPEEYEPETQFFRLVARSRMDYGWRIRQVRAFSNAECSGKGLSSLTITAPSTSAIGVSPLENKDLVDVDKVGPESQCSNAKCEDYWSMGLNVNPYSVDETHDLGPGGAFLEFTVASDDPVLCVEVISRTIGPDGAPRQYYPTDATLLRGFYDDGFRVLERSTVDVFGWTESWDATGSSGAPEGAAHVFKTSCGQADTRIYGELLMQQAGVRSACHCKQLCIDTWQGTETGGCVSWNYQVSPFNMCFLQSTIRPMPSDTCEPAANVISGFTGLRIEELVTDPPTVAPGQPFTLSVNGVNMPAEENAFLQMTTPTRQRVKIVPKMTGGEATSCADGEVAETVDGIGCSHPFFCAPRPSSYSMSSASWSDLTIYGTSSPTETYSVCYNRGFTYDRYEWHNIGDIVVESGAFVWSAPSLLRTTPEFSITVHDSPFGTSNTSFWDLKFVKSYFDCAAVNPDAKLSVDSAMVTIDVDARTVEWSGIVVYNESTESFADVGKYKVCFKPSDEAAFMQIPGAGGEVYLSIEAEEGYSTHPRQLYSYQKLSGKIGVENDFTLEGFRLILPSASKIGFYDALATQLFVADIDNSKSSPDAYVFTGTPDAPLEAGDYTVMYCSDQDAVPMTALQNEQFGMTTAYIVTENYACAGGAFNIQELSETSDLCALKCSRGCIGPDCFCEAFDPAEATGTELADLGEGPEPLCVDAVGCREACAAEDDCTGYDYYPETNFCFLLNVTNDCDMGYKGGALHWDKMVNYTTCDIMDFEHTLGTVSLTERVEVGVDWVLTPGEMSSIEVLGVDMSWQTDRIMVIDYTGICGISSVAQDVTLASGLITVPLTDMRAQHWLAHLSKDFVDEPAEVIPGCGPDWMTTVLPGKTSCDDECAGLTFFPGPNICTGCMVGGVGRITEEMAPTLSPPAFYCPMPAPPPATPAEVAYTRVEDSFCAGNNAGMAASPDQCFSKCVTSSPCEGPGCFCTALLNGYDGPDSDALCLGEEECLEACAGHPDCVGIDMHKELPRCFLNLKASETHGVTDSCEFYVDYGRLTPSPDYNYIYKQAEPNRRLTQYKRRLAGDELTMLRFEHVMFSTGGQFKACFCDVDTLEAGASCKTAADYKIEIGTIHVSGVSCLVENRRFQRGTCVAQGVGGLRCYPGAAPTYVVPEVATPTVAAVTVEDEVFDPVMSTYCLYGPEEETSGDPFCA